MNEERFQEMTAEERAEVFRQAVRRLSPEDQAKLCVVAWALLLLRNAQVLMEELARTYPELEELAALAEGPAVAVPVAA